jgi:hypothetical protein
MGRPTTSYELLARELEYLARLLRLPNQPAFVDRMIKDRLEFALSIKILDRDQYEGLAALQVKVNRPKRPSTTDFSLPAQ